jgi:hypothetical protein
MPFLARESGFGVSVTRASDFVVSWVWLVSDVMLKPRSAAVGDEIVAGVTAGQSALIEGAVPEEEAAASAAAAVH